jgi:hypothetical protein
LFVIAFIPLPAPDGIKPPSRGDAVEELRDPMAMCIERDPACLVAEVVSTAALKVPFLFDYGTTITRYEDLTKARFALASLQYYILPFLYGLLGTCVYILRNLAEELRKRSFSSDVAYRLRVPLGALAGVTIAMVAIPDNSVELSKTLPPLALALVAGYAVEVLFAAMDRFIAAFSNDQLVGTRGPARGDARS